MKTKSFFGILSSIVLFVGLNSCNQNPVNNQQNNDTIKKEDSVALVKVWDSPQELKMPESVLYDKQDNILFAACMGTENAEKKDGDGFLSQLSVDGKIINLKWIAGLNDPKGMGILNGKLYVTDINEVLEIDIQKAKIIKKYPAKNAKFLNDLVIDTISGIIYMSDMWKNEVVYLKEGKIEVLVSSDSLTGFNGLCFFHDSLFVGTQNALLYVDVKNKSLAKYINNTGGIDGLTPDGKGSFFISDWAGHVSIINPFKPRIIISDTTPMKIGAADFDVIPNKNIIVIPTFFDNRLMAYQINPS